LFELARLGLLPLPARVARWFVFKPNIQIWVNFGGSCNGRCCYILRTLGPCYGLLRTLGISHGNLAYFSPFWYFVPRKIWQPCIQPEFHFSVFVQTVVNFAFCCGVTNQ
jgi:hypothetical protein